MKIMGPRRVTLHAWLWLLHIITGLGLGLYVIIHMFDVGSIIIGRNAYDYVASLLEEGPLSVVTYIVLWLIGIGLIIHTINGLRIASKPYGAPSIMYRHLCGTKHKGTWFWLLQVMTGSLLVAFLAIHYFTIHGFGGGTISFEKSISRINNPWFIMLYVVTLVILLYHTLNGIRSVLIKVGITASVAKDNKLTKALYAVGTIFLVIGIVAIIRFITIG